jgi:hypothetical protein
VSIFADMERIWGIFSSKGWLLLYKFLDIFMKKSKLPFKMGSLFLPTNLFIFVGN